LTTFSFAGFRAPGTAANEGFGITVAELVIVVHSIFSEKVPCTTAVSSTAVGATLSEMLFCMGHEPEGFEVAETTVEDERFSATKKLS